MSAGCMRSMGAQASTATEQLRDGVGSRGAGWCERADGRHDSGATARRVPSGEVRRALVWTLYLSFGRAQCTTPTTFRLSIFDFQFSLRRARSARREKHGLKV